TTSPASPSRGAIVSAQIPVTSGAFAATVAPVRDSWSSLGTRSSAANASTTRVIVGRAALLRAGATRAEDVAPGGAKNGTDADAPDASSVTVPVKRVCGGACTRSDTRPLNVASGVTSMK